jgi:signal transduction histidine kinase
MFALLIGAVATLVSLNVQITVTKQALREDSLNRAAQYIADHLQIDPSGEAHLATPPGSSSASIDYQAVVFDRNGRILLEQPARLDPELVGALSERRRAADRGHSPGADRFFTLALGERRIVGKALLTGSGDDDRVIEVFTDEAAPDPLTDNIVRGFAYRSAQVLVPLFALVLLIGSWIAWRRMRPIEQVSAIAETIGPHTLNTRLPERDLPAEMLPIVQSVNRALERLHRADETQREFLRRAAHHLRTPLMVLSARTDSLDDYSETTAELRRDVRELSRVVSQLLQLNEIDALPDGEAVADLAAVGEAVRDELAPRAARQDKRIELMPPDDPVLVRGDPNVIEIAVRNLVENAIQHSPPGLTIDLRIGADARLEVVDAGPGIADDRYDRIFEPFWSGDPHGVRAGLGLTIVSRIAERYAASVTVTAAPGGGARFAMQFQQSAVRLTDLDPAAVRASVPASLAHRRRREALDRAAD